MKRLSPVLWLLLVACQAGTPASGSPSGEASPLRSPSSTGTSSSAPSEQPTAPPTAAPPTPAEAHEPDWGFMPPGGDARVSVDVGLRLREGPGTYSAIVATLAEETIVRMAGPPWQRHGDDGFQWRRVTVGSNPEDRLAGWVATGGTDTVLTLEPIVCPDGAMDLDTVIRMTDLARLTCLRGEELVLEGTVVTGFGGFIRGKFEPAWLAHPFGFSGVVEAAGCCFAYHQPPGSESVSAADGDRLRLTGHFDDPAAADCRIATDDPPIAEPDELAVVYCRERFVVTSIEILAP